MKKYPFYCFVKALAAVIFPVYTPMKVVRKAELPEGRIVVCSNHLSMPDPVYLGVLQKRQIFFMGKAELFQNKLLAAFFRGLGCFPVARGTGDTQALDRASEILQQEQPLGIFLEGTRSKTGEFLRPKTGAAMLAFKNNAPVIPVCITGAKGGKIIPFRKVYISFGEVMSTSELGIENGTGMEFRAASRKIMDEIAAMREEHLALIHKSAEEKA